MKGDGVMDEDEVYEASDWQVANLLSGSHPVRLGEQIRSASLLSDAS